MPNPDYFRPVQIPGTLLSPWLLECLSIHGQNRMVSPIQSFPGSVMNPGITFFGHERTGWWIDETTADDEWVFSIFGLEVFRLTDSGIMYKGAYSRPVQNEVPAGLINSSNVTYTLAHTP